MSTKHDYMLQLAGKTDDLWVLVVAIDRALGAWERDGVTLAEAHPDSAVGRLQAIRKSLDNAAHGRAESMCKVHWTKEQYAALGSRVA